MARALALIDEEPWRRQRLLALAAHARRVLGRVPGVTLPATADTQILPVILGEEARAIAVAAALQAAGFDTRAIRPPTVPAGTSRLRVSLGVERTEAEIDALALALGHALRREAA